MVLSKLLGKFANREIHQVCCIFDVLHSFFLVVDASIDRLTLPKRSKEIAKEDSMIYALHPVHPIKHSHTFVKWKQED